MQQLSIVLTFVLYIFTSSATAHVAYDPLYISNNASFQIHDLTVHDNARDRNIPIRIYLPNLSSRTPLILFSPGLGGSRTGYAYLARHWALCRFTVVVLQHPGSDNRVWQGKSRTQAITAMRRAASGRNFLLRIQDVNTVLNYLTDLDHRSGGFLSDRLDLANIGMAGHSFGARTTEAISGERFRGRALFTDPRITAALALSPSSPSHESATDAFSQVEIPWMVMTGTRDIGLLGLGTQTVAARLAVYDALPSKHKYELVLANAQHMAFSDRPLPPTEPARNPNDHRAIIALSTAYWDAMLYHQHQALTWLTTRAQSVLKPGDQWRWK